MPYTFDIGALIREHAAILTARSEQDTPARLLYAEKADGFQCRSCRYAVPTNLTHGKCQIMTGTIHLDRGCCAAWAYHPELLQVREA